ncbi:hypothetical protein ABID25_006712 [Mesorhizobium abyssinicae]
MAPATRGSLDALDVADSERNNLPVLIEHRAQRVHQFRALVDNAFASAEQNRPRLLIWRLGFDEAHFRLTRRSDDGLGIGGIILLWLPPSMQEAFQPDVR